VLYYKYKQQGKGNPMQARYPGQRAKSLTKAELRDAVTGPGYRTNNNNRAKPKNKK
jgi:hypothetical protein